MAASVHDGCWGAKALLVAAGWIASWWIPDAFFTDFYMQMAKYVSAIFLLYQVIMMLAAAYIVNERLVKNVDNDETACSKVIIIAFTLVIFAGDITFIVTNFMNFNCGRAIAW